MDDGPTKGATLMPLRCAKAANDAPGSAIPGQPASDSIPTLCPASNGAIRAGKSFSAVCSLSNWKLSSRTGLFVLTDPKKRRALFSFSTTKYSKVCTSFITSAGMTLLRLSSPKVTGTMYKVPSTILIRLMCKLK